ncbi:MAG: histidine phosphatase family protein [Chloroflexi bacterium]|nr:histidine phosphatase family protein [Chloroflexota bacterium]
MTRIILVRHGQTEWNREERFRGQEDIPLNETGRQQARRVAYRLKNDPITAIYASPLRRSIQTAEIIAASRDLDVQIDDAFLDIHYGTWAGLSPAEVAARDAEMYRLWLTAPHLAHPPKGECLEDVRARVLRGIERIVLRYPRATVVVVGHQVVNKVLLCAVLGLDGSAFWRIRQDNACINIFIVENSTYEVVCLNDTCHLQEKL